MTTPIAPVAFTRLEPMLPPPRPPTLPDHDGGDEHADSGFVCYPMCSVRMGGVAIGFGWWMVRDNPPGECQDCGDEDDYHAYRPSSTGGFPMRVWAPR